MAGVGGAAGIIAGGALVMMGAVGAIWLGLRAIYLSIKPRPPTERQLREENLNQNPLFRHFEVLKGKIAWRAIGEYPTPCHSVQTTTPSGVHVEFSVKREDLASALYGGNKIRTLQHQVHLHPLSCRTLSCDAFGCDSSLRAKRIERPTPKPSLLLSGALEATRSSRQNFTARARSGFRRRRCTRSRFCPTCPTSTTVRP